MCGIVGYTGDQNSAPILLDGLKKLEYRGYDSAGIAVINNGAISISKTTGRIANLCVQTNDGKEIPGKTGIGHTRWATHGAPTDINAHPHISNDKKFAIVHNGIIENYVSLKQELISKGFTFLGQTDSEVVVHLIEMYYKGDFKNAVMKAVSRLKGSYALGIVCTDFPDTIFVVKEASPLILGVGVNENFFASDVTALMSHTKNVIYLEDGEFAQVSPREINVFRADGKKIKKQITRVKWDIGAAEKGGYDHFMLKEIMEQPRAVKDAIYSRLKNNKVEIEGINKIDLSKINKIVMSACGSAYYACCNGRYAIEKLCKIPVETQLASELRYSDPIMDDKTLLIVVSQSGETADTIAAMKQCKLLGTKIIAIVNVVGSAIAKLADCVLYTWAGPEIAVATTKGFTTQVGVLYSLAVYIANATGKLSESDYAKYVAELKALPALVQKTINLNPNIQALAKKYCNNSSVFFIGRNTDYAVSLEGALKLKEISYVHAEAYAAGELKHGTIALIESKQPVIALCCNDDLFEKTMNNVIEVKARGAKVIALAKKNNDKVLEHSDDTLYIPQNDTIFYPLYEVIPLQLIAYYIAKERGCDIDKPKNLAKSVTVE